MIDAMVLHISLPVVITKSLDTFGSQRVWVRWMAQSSDMLITLADNVWKEWCILGKSSHLPVLVKRYSKFTIIQTCSVGTDHGYGYGYGYEAMGMGTGTGLRPWVWVRVRVRDHGYGYGYGYDMWQSHGYGYGYGYEAIDMGMGTGMGPWVWVPWVRVWVRVQDVKSRMKDCGYNYSYATLYLGTCTWVPNWIWDFGEE